MSVISANYGIMDDANHSVGTIVGVMNEHRDRFMQQIHADSGANRGMTIEQATELGMHGHAFYSNLAETFQGVQQAIGAVHQGTVENDQGLSGMYHL
ncbi:hypothetical protein P0W64_16530 [Tsukamurella sp. 8F]|uniref:hypothetical protein n=1 Tax=unclassified Tsukamurella TaxID=2633480 RepID=UPI0023B966DC|nr:MULTISPECIES: hypothetical protein [unclassified Tsukamurella]MDF0531142.1 hypothetical protein [Tsukamurella sp. 8J]MDF0588388.1 hypothetical protein [Tsukamurella sp. 8F]